jgi:hypothetical protein
MTAACPGGGASQIKPGTLEKVVVGSTLISAGLGIISPWLIPFAALADAFNWEALTECTTDPPTMPTTAQLDPINAVGGVFNPNFNNWLTAIHNLLINWLWTQYCQCVSGTATAPTYPPAPTDSTVPLTAPVVPCSDLKWQGVGVTTAQANVNGPQITQSAQLLPYPVVSRNAGSLATYPSGNCGSAPPTQMIIDETWISGGTGGDDSTLIVIGWTGAGTGQAINTQIGFVNSSNPHVQTKITVPSNVTAITFQVTNRQTVSTIVQQVEVQLLCSGSSGGVSTPCTTDPNVLNLLNSMWTAIQEIYTETTLLQRQLIPFAYISGTAHAGLHDQGTIAIASPLLGIRIDLTTIPPQLGQDVSEPTFYFDVGWVSVLDANGFVDQRRITRVNTVWMPRIMSDATVIGYSFHSGIVATITEIEREP